MNRIKKINISIKLLTLFICSAFNSEILYSQISNLDCIDLLEKIAVKIKSRPNTIEIENEIINQLLSCDTKSISKEKLQIILGEPNERNRYYDGIEKSYFESIIYYMKPTYESKYFVGQTIQFQFKEGNENCFKIEQIRYCE